MYFFNNQVVSSIKILLSTNTDIRFVNMHESLLVQDGKDNVLEERKLC